MKRYVVCVMLSSLLIGDEIQRIESIVDDITKLRGAYEECQQQLHAKTPHVLTNSVDIMTQKDTINELSRLLKDEQQKNIILGKELERVNILAVKSQEFESEIEELKKQINIEKNKLKTKGNEDNSLEKKYIEIIASKEKIILDLENQIKNMKKTNKTIVKKQIVSVPLTCEEENSFPTLVFKEKYKEEQKVEKKIEPLPMEATEVFEEVIIIQKETDKVEPKTLEVKEATNQEKVTEKIVLETTSPSTYKLLNESDIYNGINGEKITKWEEGTSFTSNQKYNDWIKITGYFINKKWLRAKEELWILKQNVLKRK